MIYKAAVTLQACMREVRVAYHGTVQRCSIQYLLSQCKLGRLHAKVYTTLDNTANALISEKWPSTFFTQ